MKGRMRPLDRVGAEIEAPVGQAVSAYAVVSLGSCGSSIISLAAPNKLVDFPYGFRCPLLAGRLSLAYRNVLPSYGFASDLYPKSGRSPSRKDLAVHVL